jgi:ABC-type thiamin/hydroxymethylpyrimidine transport system permease subunit
MIQRIQSVWLLLAAICAFLTFRVSFFYGLRTGATVNEALNATSDMLLIITAAATGLGAFIAIFLYKDRKVQLRVTMIALVVAVLNLVLYFVHIKQYADGRFSLTSIVSFIIPVFLLLSARGIWKDQKLIKSLDRLR